MIAVPDTLTHYYRKVSGPFRSLTGLTSDDGAEVVRHLATLEPLPRRLATANYLPRRREIEHAMREQFIAKGGRPVLTAPFYLVLGTFSLWERVEGYASIQIPLNAIRPDVVSFTYPDSWVSFVGEMLSGEKLPRFAYHGQVFRCDELGAVLAEFGLPAERWQTDHERRMETYIEAQLWSDAALSAYL